LRETRHLLENGYLLYNERERERERFSTRHFIWTCQSLGIKFALFQLSAALHRRVFVFITPQVRRANANFMHFGVVILFASGIALVVDFYDAKQINQALKFYSIVFYSTSKNIYFEMCTCEMKTEKVRINYWFQSRFLYVSSRIFKLLKKKYQIIAVYLKLKWK